jgi:hypothetical protein
MVRTAKDEFRAYLLDSTRLPGTLPPSPRKTAEFVQQLRVELFLVRDWVACATATIRPRKTTSPKTDLRGSSIFGEVANCALEPHTAKRNVLATK